MTLREKMQAIRPRIISAYQQDGRGFRKFNLGNGRVVRTKEFADLLKEDVPALAGEKRTSVIAEMNRILVEEYGRVRIRTEDLEGPPPLPKAPKVYELTTPSGEQFLLRTRDTESEVTFLTTIKIEQETTDE